MLLQPIGQATVAFGAFIMLGSFVVVIPLLAQGLWPVLRSVLRACAFLRVLLAARPRLQGTLRQMTIVNVHAYIFAAYIFGPVDGWSLVLLPYTHALFVVVILGVAVDIEWWFVERPSERVLLVTVLFPACVRLCVTFCGIFCGVFLLDVFVRTMEDPRINALHEELLELCAPPPFRTQN